MGSAPPPDGQRRGVGIVGAGALGLTAAYRLTRRGIPVTVFEKEAALGGLAASFRVGDAWLEKFYHHLFRTDRDAIALIDELGLGPKLVWKQPRTGLIHQGEIYSLAIPDVLLRLAPLPPLDRLRMLAVMVYLKLEGNYHRLERYTADAWVRRWMGENVYRVVYGPVLRAKFGELHDQIAMSWLWSRVHERSIGLGYVRGGFQQAYERLGEEVRRAGGEIRLGTPVSAIASGPDGPALEVAGETLRFERVLSTLPTRLFTHVARDLPRTYLERHDWGEAYGAHCAILSLDRQLTDTYWLNITDPGYPFLVLVEHTNYMPSADYGGRHLVYLGNYLPMSAPLFARSDAEVLAEFLPAIRRLVPGFRDEWVKESWVFKAPFAQPIVTREYREHIPPHETPLPGVYTANMFQVYPQDRGQNYSIRMANRVAGMIGDSIRVRV